MSNKIEIDPVLIDVPMPIVTPRLMLRPPQAGDGKAVHEARRESWPELFKWGIWTHKPLEEMTVEHDELFCRKKHAKFILREDIPLLSFNRQSGIFLGGAGLHKCDWERRIFTVGYWVRTGQTGQGYATEVAAALVRYAFAALSARKVSTFHAEGNAASQRVIEKVGFEREGVLRMQHGFLDGLLVDEYWYGLLNDKNLSPLDVQWGIDT
jgi:RimJ/RimL family protein N-acetyltransferase